MTRSSRSQHRTRNCYDL